MVREAPRWFVIWLQIRKSLQPTNKLINIIWTTLTPTIASKYHPIREDLLFEGTQLTGKQLAVTDLTKVISPLHPCSQDLLSVVTLYAIRNAKFYEASPQTQCPFERITVVSKHSFWHFGLLCCLLPSYWVTVRGIIILALIPLQIGTFLVCNCFGTPWILPYCGRRGSICPLPGGTEPKAHPVPITLSFPWCVNSEYFSANDEETIIIVFINNLRVND